MNWLLAMNLARLRALHTRGTRSVPQSEWTLSSEWLVERDRFREVAGRVFPELLAVVVVAAALYEGTRHDLNVHVVHSPLTQALGDTIAALEDVLMRVKVEEDHFPPRREKETT